MMFFEESSNMLNLRIFENKYDMAILPLATKEKLLNTHPKY